MNTHALLMHTRTCTHHHAQTQTVTHIKPSRISNHHAYQTITHIKPSLISNHHAYRTITQSLSKCRAGTDFCVCVCVCVCVRACVCVCVCVCVWPAGASPYAGDSLHLVPKPCKPCTLNPVPCQLLTEPSILPACTQTKPCTL